MNTASDKLITTSLSWHRRWSQP